MSGGSGGSAHPKPSLAGDWHNMFLLLALYTLQGVPLGFASSVPMYMESRGASFAEQATFSLATWPYSLKLLWAPIVDSLFTTRWRLGLRKTWIIPTQMVTGLVLIALSAHLNDAFGGQPEDTSTHAAAGAINVAALTAAFFGLYFLAATQDIAVDGWALTLLRPENLGYASAANTIGQSFGIMLAYGALLTLDSPAFCNAYLRGPLGLPHAETGLVTMSGFMCAWGVAFLIATGALWIFKREDPPAAPPALATAAETPAAAAAAAAAAAMEGDGGSVDDTAEPPIATPATASDANSGGNSISRPRHPGGHHHHQHHHSASAAAQAAATEAALGARPALGDGERPTLVGGALHLGETSSDSDSGDASGDSGFGEAARQPAASGAAGTEAAADSVPPAAANAVVRVSGKSPTPGGGNIRRRASPAGRRMPAPAAASSSSGGGAAAQPASPGASVVVGSAAARGAGTADGEEEDEQAQQEGSALLPSTTPSSSASAVAPSPSAPPPPSQSNWVADMRALAATVSSSYTDLWAVLRLSPVLWLILFLSTSKVWHAPVDYASSLLLQRRGVSRETIALFDTISTPLQLAMQVAVSRVTAGRRPLSLWLTVYPLRLLVGLGWLGIIYGLLAPPGDGASPTTPVLALVFLLSNAHAIVSSAMFLSVMSFFNQVADASMGGTYMTLLNTVANLGSKWPHYFILNGIEALTVKTCSMPGGGGAVSGGGMSCKLAVAADACKADGGVCTTERDGFLLLTLVGIVGGLTWLALIRRRVKMLEAMPRDAWLLRAASGAASPVASA